jgi:hypothetical protein
MKTYFVASLVVMLPLSSGAAQACGTADSYSSHMIGVINSLMAPADSLFRRDELHLPSASGAQISLVTDENVCTHARQALDSLAAATNPDAPNPPPARPVYVFAILTHFGVVDRTQTAGEWIPLFFYSPLWEFLSVHLPF